MIEKNILFVGCGKMGAAILEGILSSKKINSQNIFVIKPHNNKEFADKYGVNIFKDISDIEEDINIDILIFAVKPQILDEILSKYKKFTSNSLFISIAAGKTIDSFSKYLGDSAKIVRTMPNLPATIGKAITAIYAKDDVKSKNADIINAIFNNIGEVIWLDKEEDMDAVTAISGSGPAYLFHFIESLILSAQNIGLNEEQAKILVDNTILGSALLNKESQKTAKILRQEVTSKKGTTEAALNIFMEDNKLENLVNDAVKAAYNRSKELNLK